MKSYLEIDSIALCPKSPKESQNTTEKLFQNGNLKTSEKNKIFSFLDYN